MSRSIVFVGQGPNRAAWERGLELGEHLVKCRSEGSAPANPIEIAERYCERVAITGAIGRKIGDLIGMEVGPFSRKYARRNLNARWLGKDGKGDIFDSNEGERRAAQIRTEGFERVVLIGRAVQKCFGFTYDASSYLSLGCEETTSSLYFFLPHPSGINPWWNNPENEALAKAELRSFLGLQKNDPLDHKL